MELFEALNINGGCQRQAIIKHLKVVGIKGWTDLTKVNLMSFRDELKETLAPSSAKTVAAAFSAFLHRYEEEGYIPCKGFSDILRIRGEKCLKTYLKEDEIKMLENVRTDTKDEEYVLNEFIVGCKTAARISDIRRFTTANIQGDNLTYTSQKTGITAVVHCSARTRRRIEWLTNNKENLELWAYNDILKRLCKRAGINEVVKVHKGGKDKTGEKWKFISSHSARISVITNLARLGMPVSTISHYAGHASIQQTFGYIVREAPELTTQARLFLD